ncbi:uncharacterized protein LOC116350796 [Contarinia nasturtii]|uniref:uncharacterized protein LOC116350796 n=1 Tax=Contarinia nasturtii TaxID=265458 RepID=UPI0012D3F38D|nr:uncharacterized protein LOC116350796 [Contarinia nasturtii]XP_031638594.1 uncharacterized protein LOC116350796 [Contarinia nasturtii]XP_031638595.1 uncharacterized protein LOC116350796 [Contarinia nasturtii]
MTPHINDFTPFGMFLLGEEPTIEDFILLIGTIVAFIAFVLWCCFPISPKDGSGHQSFSCKSLYVLKSSQHKYTEDNHNGRNHDGSKYGLNPTYHCCNSNN